MKTRPNILFKTALLAGLLLAVQAKAYVTSAVLEFYADDNAAFHLNGSTVLERSGFCPFNYEVLSTSDGTLPMELFNPNADNLFAVENMDTEGTYMGISYRLTVHHSDGDPVRIWSVPDQAKMLHLAKADKDPAGWTLTNFNDGAWVPAKEATQVNNTWNRFPRLHDAAFANFMGLDPYVPILSHIFNMSCNTQDHNLYRSHFRFPENPGKVQVLMNPQKAVAGQQVAVRLVPGPDSAEYSQFNLLAFVPKGMEVASVSKGGQYSAKERRLSWSFGSKDLDVRYAKFGASQVISASGWQAPEKVLGLEKQGKGRRKFNTADAIWNDGAVFTSNRPGWFKMAPHNVNLTAGKPIILGVIFHSQVRLGGTDNQAVVEADKINFNYSIDGSMRGFLKNDVEISRMTSSAYWIDGYYDATEDRKWSWEDISNLRVFFEAKARGTQDRNLLSSVVATVKYYTPAKASPYFFAKITEPGCTSMKLETSTFRVGFPQVAADPITLAINEGRCPPPPRPTPTFTEVPVAVAVAPTPEPTKTGGALFSTNYFKLGCLSANPEPFNFAGTFVSFCNKKEADVTLEIYSGQSGKLVRRMKAGHFRASDQNQVFFNALDDGGKLLTAGSYTYKVTAEGEGHKEERNATFTFRPKKK